MQHMTRRFVDEGDDIEPDVESSDGSDERFLSERKLRFVAAWAGNLVAAARVAGYKDPKSAAYKLGKDRLVVKALAKKQESMLREAAEQFVRAIPLSRSDVIDRLWQLAQLSPSHTNGTITGQVKAAQALEQIFSLNIDGNELLKRRLEGKSEADLEFYAVHGFLPYEGRKPARLASAEAPQLPESTAGEKPLTMVETVNTTGREESSATSSRKGGQEPPKNLL